MRVQALVALGASTVIVTLSSLHMVGQCVPKQALSVNVIDQTGAALPASIQIGAGVILPTDGLGRLVIRCVPPQGLDLDVRAEGFESESVHVTGTTGEFLKVALNVSSVNTMVEVNGDADGGSRQSAGDVLKSRDLQALSNDPDEFQRQLLTLVGPGTNASFVTISVDGFQESTTLPPKDAIQEVKANADPFSAELAYPILGGGRLDVSTKPGTSKIHGSAFLNSSAAALNANNPYSQAAAPAGNQNEGLSITGPLSYLKGGYAASFQYRAIREQNVVNAQGLSSTLSPIPLLATVAAPTALWLGQVRAGLQVSPHDFGTASFSANENDGLNQGIGGLVLQEAGFNSHARELTLRATNDLTVGSFLHQTRIGFTWKTAGQNPLSSGPSLSVAGFFTGGGSAQGASLQRDNVLEADEIFATTKSHFDVKGGTQILSRIINDRVPNAFNGAYIFGGGSAPGLNMDGTPSGEQTYITALEQYRRTLSALPGGNPTSFRITTGSPEAALVQYQQAFFLQVGAQSGHQFSAQLGLRYHFQTEPGAFRNFAPRAGLVWTPSSGAAALRGWTFRLNAGLFVSPLSYRYARDIALLDGIRNQQDTVYSPQFIDPTTLVPGAIEVKARRFFSPAVHPDTFLQTETTIERSLGTHWLVSAGLIGGQDWGRMFIRNINAPILRPNLPQGNIQAALLSPRPITPNEDIFAYQSTGHLIGVLPQFRISSNGYKGSSFQLRYEGQHVRGDANQLATSPQSTYSKAGESSRPDFQVKNSLLFSSTFRLPFAIQAGSQFDYSTGQPFDINTGSDANGDGSFNDRPSYAATATIVPGNGNGVYNTKYGTFSTVATNGTVPRNLGTMPSIEHLSASLERSFRLTRQPGPDGQTLSVSARSSNLLNHTNVTAVDNILGSSTFNDGVTAEPSRRIELGVRYSF